MGLNIRTPAASLGLLCGGRVDRLMDFGDLVAREATPTSTGNNAVTTGNLGGSHSAHFDQGKTCSNCHPVPTGISDHAIAALPVNDANVTVQLATGTWTAGTLTCSNTGAGCLDL